MDDSPIRPTRLLEEYFPGSLIGGKYALETVVGQGGMGAVWRADNVVLDMPVAIKLIRPGVRGAGTTKLLLNEARLAAKLEHPSVVRLFDFGVAETGDAYIVMELLKGPSLVDLLQHHGKLSAITAVQLLIPIVHGLSAAHRQGIVHLDLKPENIVISELGSRPQPKLLDFGIAKKIGLRNNADSGGSFVGTPAYTSPELACANREIDARADIWGICAVLYELVSGRAPFAGASVSKTLRAVVEDAPTSFEDLDDDARSLWPIVERGLAKDRQRRFANARQLGEVLATWLIGRGEYHDVCGERLISSWGPEVRARAAVTWLPASGERPVHDTVSTLKPRRWPWVSAVACLSVAAAAAFVLMRMDPERPGSVVTPRVVDAQRGASTQVIAPVELEPTGDAIPQLMAASPTKPEERSVKKVLRATTRVKLPKPRTREAELGLKDPFQ